METFTIAVAGSGTMGGGIAQAAAQSGFRVLLYDIREDYLLSGEARIRERLQKRVAEGKLTREQQESILSRITTSTRLEDLSSARLIVEAVIEREGAKTALFSRLDGICPPETVFASNTSSIPITRLASATTRPDRFAGMHFMNPAYVMKLVEVVRGKQTSAATVDLITSTAQALGKTWVVVEDAPGFVANRLLMPMINEAAYCLQEGVATKEDIDTVMRLGANHPMGPLELADFIGLDVCLDILGVLETDLGGKFSPCPLLQKMVDAGRLGRKSGEGFYDYK